MEIIFRLNPGSINAVVMDYYVTVIHYSLILHLTRKAQSQIGFLENLYGLHHSDTTFKMER